MRVGLLGAGRAEVALEGVEQGGDLGVAAARGLELALLDGLGAVLLFWVWVVAWGGGAGERRPRRQATVAAMGIFVGARP